MFSKLNKLLVAVGLVLGSATVASAGGGTAKKQSDMQKSTMQGSKSITGNVIATKSVRLKGSNQQHLVALVKTQDGDRKLVDLGPREDARGLMLTEGDKLTARGTSAQVRGQQVLIANSARSGEESLTIDRAMQRKHFDQNVQTAHESICPPDEG